MREVIYVGLREDKPATEPAKTGDIDPKRRSIAARDRRYTISSTVDRRNRIFIDYLRNGRGSSAVGVPARTTGISSLDAGQLGTD